MSVLPMWSVVSKQFQLKSQWKLKSDSKIIWIPKTSNQDNIKDKQNWRYEDFQMWSLTLNLVQYWGTTRPALTQESPETIPLTSVNWFTAQALRDSGQKGWPFQQMVLSEVNFSWKKKKTLTPKPHTTHKYYFNTNHRQAEQESFG